MTANPSPPYARNWTPSNSPTARPTAPRPSGPIQSESPGATAQRNLPGHPPVLHIISTAMRIHPLDLAIVIAYLLGVTALGMRFRRGQRNATDYFLGGRTAPWWALAFSIVATETSTLTIIGTPAISYGS